MGPLRIERLVTRSNQVICRVQEPFVPRFIALRGAVVLDLPAEAVTALPELAESDGAVNGRPIARTSLAKSASRSGRKRLPSVNSAS